MKIVLFENGMYYKANIVNGHVQKDLNPSKRYPEVYNIWAKSIYGIILTEEIINSLKIVNLGYIKTDRSFIVFDISKEEYEQEILPVYTNSCGVITRTEESVVFKNPTTKSIEAAEKICEEVNKGIISLHQKNEVEKIKRIIEEGNGIAYVKMRDNYAYDLINLLCKDAYKLLLLCSDGYVIGKVAKKPVLDLYVPEKVIPLVIGKDGEKIKKIASEINAKRINVKPT